MPRNESSFSRSRASITIFILVFCGERAAATSIELRASLLDIRSELERNLASSANIWDSGGAEDVCTWPGIGCDQRGDIVALDLSNSGLRGTLPRSLPKLTGLLTINLSNNTLGGALPSEWSSLYDLEVLVLDDNLITGSLPSSWAALSNLRELHLRNNSLSGGCLPSAWGGGLTALQVLDLSQNPQLCGGTGIAPSSWGRLGFMRTLALRNTGLAGMLPAEWATMRRLIQMDLSSNSIVGTLPGAWASGLSQLRLLDVSRNALRGTLPTDWSQLSSLQQASFHTNALSGTVPEVWGSLQGLAGLRLAANAPLCGPLPAVLLSGPMAGLPVGSQAANASAGGGVAGESSAVAAAIDGTLLLRECPWSRTAGFLQSFRSSLSDPRAALSSWVDGTDPCGAAGPWAGVVCDASTGSVVGLELQGLGLSGTLPPQLAMLGSGLTKLALDDNSLSGALPDSWSALTGLTHFSAARNNLGGSLPGSWSSMRDLSYIDLSYNQLKGPLPDEWCDGWWNISDIHLDGNGLNGTLPVAWGGIQGGNTGSSARGGLISLASLTADGNSLSGSLPDSWSRLRVLRELSLNQNLLTGSVPSSWAAGMTSLRYLGLSSNGGLCGRVPFADTIDVTGGANASLPASSGSASSPAGPPDVRLESESTQLGASCPVPEEGPVAASVQLLAAAGASALGTLVLVGLVAGAVHAVNRHRQRSASCTADHATTTGAAAAAAGIASPARRPPSLALPTSPRAPPTSPYHGAYNGPTGLSLNGAASPRSVPGLHAALASRQLSNMLVSPIRDPASPSRFGSPSPKSDGRGGSGSPFSLHHGTSPRGLPLSTSPRPAADALSPPPLSPHRRMESDVDVCSAASPRGIATGFGSPRAGRVDSSYNGAAPTSGLQGFTRLMSSLIARRRSTGGANPTTGTADGLSPSKLSPQQHHHYQEPSDEDTAAAAEIYQALLLAEDALPAEHQRFQPPPVLVAADVAGGADAVSRDTLSHRGSRSPRLSSNPLYGQPAGSATADDALAYTAATAHHASPKYGRSGANGSAASPKAGAAGLTTTTAGGGGGAPVRSRKLRKTADLDDEEDDSGGSGDVISGERAPDSNYRYNHQYHQRHHSGSSSDHPIFADDDTAVYRLSETSSEALTSSSTMSGPQTVFLEQPLPPPSQNQTQQIRREPTLGGGVPPASGGLVHAGEGLVVVAAAEAAAAPLAAAPTFMLRGGLGDVGGDGEGHGVSTGPSVRLSPELGQRDWR